MAVAVVKLVPLAVAVAAVVNTPRALLPSSLETRSQSRLGLVVRSAQMEAHLVSFTRQQQYRLTLAAARPVQREPLEELAEVVDICEEQVGLAALPQALNVVVAVALQGIHIVLVQPVEQP